LDIGSKIRTFRKRKGISQRELAKLIGKSHSTVSKYEINQRNPSPGTLVTIAENLDIKAADLFN